jgi:hypothetical protein
VYRSRIAVAWPDCQLPRESSADSQRGVTRLVLGGLLCGEIMPSILREVCVLART